MSDDEEPEDAAPSAAEPGADSAVPSRSSRRKRSKIETEEGEATVFWETVFSSPVGRREMWRLVCGTVGAHAFETRFPSGAVGFPDPNAAWYARGEQDFGLRMYHEWLRRFPLLVAQMHTENDHRFANPKRRKGE